MAPGRGALIRVTSSWCPLARPGCCAPAPRLPWSAAEPWWSGAVGSGAPAEQTEGTRPQIRRWLKPVGERVAENGPLIEIETDKVTVEVASPGTGVLREIIKHEQEEITPGELLGRSEAVTAAAALAPASRPAAAAAPSASPVAVRSATRARAPEGGLTPAVRRLLGERGLDASAIRGTGPGGRITVEDVLRAAPGRGPDRRRDAGATRPAPALAPDAQAGAPAEGIGTSHRVPHTAIRKRTPEHMRQRPLHPAPHV